MPLTKICLHWTAGGYFPCDIDKKSYHFLIDKNGKIYNGHFKPEGNLICKPSKYAMHCGGGNTGCIGISACAMAEFDLKNKNTKYPLTKKQVESMCKLTAEKCIKYKIEVSEETIFTHWEFGQKNPKTTSYGKIDLTYLPYLPKFSPKEVADYLRTKIKWYQNN